MKVLTSQANSVIYYGFILLVFFTPFIFYSGTYELFEFNKMMFVYLMTIIITTFWSLKMVSEKRFILTRTPLDLPIALFFAANLLATVFSIDQHVSIFGYYSRLNGGLLSTISYILLYYAFMANFPRERLRYLLGATVFGGFLVSLWAIPEHFGIDPSCRILVESWEADCWVQDVTARVFATLGQPNWLAAYLAMLIPLSLALTLQEKNFGWKVFYLISSVSMVMAFIFTYSRGGMLGLIVGLILFVSLLFLGNKKVSLPKLGSNWPFVGIVAVAILMMALLYGTAFTQPLRLGPEEKPEEETPTSQPAARTTTLLESGGDETGQIRLIVWQGAVDIWKNYPLFGSGVETFAYSYYQHRPEAHNQTTEWDFLYNKAHNEYLNYLATTGALGFLSYLFLIATVILYTIYKLWTTNPHHRLIIAGLLAGYVTYLVQNIFSFSVVMIALLFFLFPAIMFKLFSEETVTIHFLNLRIPNLLNRVSLPKFDFLASKPSVLGVPVLIVSFILLFGLFRLYNADLKFSDGFQNEGEGGWETSKYLIEQAVMLNPTEPFYMAELGYVNAVLSTLSATDEEGAQLAGDAEYWATRATQISPYSLSYWKTLIKVYTELTGLYEGYEDKALEAAKKSKELAPTDPKVILTLGTLYSQLGQNTEALAEFKIATELKPDYREASLELARAYDKNGQRDEAIRVYKDLRVRFPQEVEAMNRLREWTGSEDGN